MPSKEVNSEEKEVHEDTNNANVAFIEDNIQKLSINHSEKTESLPSDGQKTDEIDENNNEEDNDKDNHEDDDDDDDGWINPSNIKQINKNNQIDSEEKVIRDIKLKVACMTADFAMQVYQFVLIYCLINKFNLNFFRMF